MHFHFRKTSTTAPALLLALVSSVACTVQTTELDPSPGGSGGKGPTGENPGGSGGLSSGGSGGGSGGTTPIDQNPSSPALPTIDPASVIDFPASVTVASPVGAPGAPPPNGPGPGGNALSASGYRLLQDGAPSVDEPKHVYAASTAFVAGVISGEVDLAERFDPRSFFVRAGNANCYGPSLAYAGHPDAPGGDAANGQLPGGDLGIWTASTESGEACAAAQLNARMRDVQAQVDMGLTGLAGIIAAYQADGHTWPDDVAPGSTIDLTDALEAVGIDEVAFIAASMSLDATGNVWSYTLDFDYAADTGPKNISIVLSHAVTDREGALFEGLLSYLVEDSYPDRNCGDGPDGAISVNGSVHYIKSASDRLVLQARNGTACGHASLDVDANLLADEIESSVVSGYAVDPAGTWQDNFNVFTAEFDPDTLQGSYSYAWQAGSGDSHTRVLAVGIETESSGEAYFGFGDRVQTSIGGEIRGFICNWAGPGNNHSTPDFAKYAQRQFIVRDDETGRYVVPDASASDITYAPTNACMYDGTGSFVYDRDLDQSLEDESAETASVMTSGTTLPFDLMTVGDGEASIWDHIQGRAYSLPSYP